MFNGKRSKTNLKKLKLKIDDFSDLVFNTFRLKNKNLFNKNIDTPPANTTASNSKLYYPPIPTNSENKNKIRSNTQQNFYPKVNNSIEPLSSTTYNTNQNKLLLIKRPEKILFTLQKTMKKINNKKREEKYKQLYENTFIINHHKNTNKLNKTLPKFKPKESKLLMLENSKNKNKFKELRFKIHNTIKLNTLPLCNSYMNKAHLFNEKLLEYYRSENHINLIKNFQKNLRFNMNMENHPKIKMYTDIGELEKISESNKVDFKKAFTPEEQKLIMLDTAYFFQRDSPNIFTNVNISGKKNLADRINDEDEEHQIKKILTELLNRKNRKKLKNIKKGIKGYDMLRNISDNTMTKINKIISSKEMKNFNPKNLDNIDLNSFAQSDNENNDNYESSNAKNNKNYNFWKFYKINLKESNKQAEKLGNMDKDRLNKINEFNFNVENKLKSCKREIDMISRDKALEKRAKEKLYYDKTKDEKNEFNIFTRQMLIELNYEYISRHRRKMMDINKKNMFDNKKDELEEENLNNTNKKKNNNILSENKDKKFINYYINKIKLNYKQQ
jgi:hypothetical protein